MSKTRAESGGSESSPQQKSTETTEGGTGPSQKTTKSAPERATSPRFCCPKCGWSSTSDGAMEFATSAIRAFNQCFGTQYRENNVTLAKMLQSLAADGYTLEDVEKVCAWAKEAWQGTRMEQYLRPATLWRRSKFPSYLEASRLAVSLATERRKAQENRERDKDPYRDAEPI